MKKFMEFNFNIENIEIACFVKAGTGKANHRNRPSHGLAFHTGGSKTYCFHKGKKLDVNKNDIIFMPRFSNYDVVTYNNGDCYAINFKISGQTEFAPFVFHTKNANGFLENFKRATTIWDRKTLGAEMKCKAELYQILYNMQQEFSVKYTSDIKYKMIQPAVDVIHQSYTEESLSIADCAKLCHITPEYFRSIFKNCFGISPLAYINQLKLTKAKELLLSGLYTVSEAALLSGYSDMSHFSRVFKKETGICPSAYKELAE